MKINYKLGIFLIILIVLVSSINAQEKLSLNVNIPTIYKEVFIGESILIETEIILIEHKPDEIIDVLIEYFVKDEKGSIIYKLSETKGGILRINDVKEIEIPNDIKPGLYIVEVKASYDNIFVVDSNSFNIIKKPFWDGDDKTILIIAIFIFIILGFLYYELYKIKKYIHYKVNGKTLFKEKLIKRR